MPRDRIRDAGTEPLHGLIMQGADTGVLAARQAEYLEYGRKIRNDMAYGQTAHAVMPPAMAVPVVTTSFRSSPSSAPPVDPVTG
ncbi:hypothetical protein [Streptomyces pharetrae]|uniref:hypothetical protein n=1 Tax=Streptomyces pharetrae TaxID=291370 RepID=UPI00267C4229